MTKPVPTSNEPCPVARATSLIGDRWSLLIVRDAFDGVRRFSDFQRSLGVAKNILSDRLRKLVDAGILACQASREGSAYQEYVLTEAGNDLFPLVLALRQWGERQLFSPGEAHSELIETASGKPVAAMLPRRQDGSVLMPHDTRVRKLP